MHSLLLLLRFRPCDHKESLGAGVTTPSDPKMEMTHVGKMCSR